MKKNSVLALLIALILLGLYIFKVPLDDGTFKVVSVSDGDTITVDMYGTEETVRLIGVDTPETHHPSKPIQCYGPEASGYVSGKLLGQYVTLQADPLSDNIDRYDRLLRFVITDDGTDFNKSLIEQGYGFSIKAFDHTKLEEYSDTETVAQQEGKGLWAECGINYDSGYASTNPYTSPSP